MPDEVQKIGFCAMWPSGVLPSLCPGSGAGLIPQVPRMSPVNSFFYEDLRILRYLWKSRLFCWFLTGFDLCALVTYQHFQLNILYGCIDVLRLSIYEFKLFYVAFYIVHL
jgi:hypothetical protein